MASQSKTTTFKEEGQLPLIHWQPRGRAINMASMKLQTNKDKLIFAIKRNVLQNVVQI